MKSILTLILSLAVSILAAQSPNWTVNENEFEYSMTRVAFLNLDGEELSSSNDKVAAFIDGEVRGVANLGSVSGSSRLYAYLTIFANNDLENVDYKIYHSATETIINVPKTDTFRINEHKGDLFQAYSIAQPTLNDEADILDFRFENENELDVIINENEVIIKLDEAASVDDLVTDFELSTGAQLWYDGQRITQNTNLDFSSPKTYQVRSEDESNLKNWIINVELIPNEINNATATFFKKEAVCHTGGAIKVNFPIDDAPVVLKKSGAEVSSGSVENGTILFSELTQGEYTVEIGSYNKEITINLN